MVGILIGAGSMIAGGLLVAVALFGNVSLDGAPSAIGQGLVFYAGVSAFIAGWRL